MKAHVILLLLVLLAALPPVMAKQRVLVLTDIENESDDTMSLAADVAESGLRDAIHTGVPGWATNAGRISVVPRGPGGLQHTAR